MMTSNKKRIKEELANGTCCYGEYIKLKKCQFTKENWNGYMVNTIQASQVQYIICRREKKIKNASQYFIVKPERKPLLQQYLKQQKYQSKIYQ